MRNRTHFSIINPLCKQRRTSCAENKRGNCLLLTDTNFKRPCPFYRERGAETARLETPLGKIGDRRERA